MSDTQGPFGSSAEVAPEHAPDGRLVRDIVWVLASLVIAGLGAVAVNSYIARTLGAAALGIFNQAFAVYIVLSQVAVGGLQFSVLRQISASHGDLRKSGEAASSALVLVSIVSAVICLLTWGLSDRIGSILGGDAVAYAVRLMLPGLCFYSLNKVLLYVLNGIRHMRAYSVFQSLRFVLILVSIALLVAAGRPGSQLTLSLTASETLLFLAMIAYLAVNRFPFTFGRAMKPWHPVHISYGLRGCLSGVFHEVNTRVDILLLGHYCDNATVGIYSFAAILAEGFAQIPLAVRTNVDPIVGHHLAADQRDQLEAFSKKVRSRFFPLMLALAAISVAVYPLVLRLLRLDPSFHASWPVFAILAAGIALNARMRPFLGVLLQAGRPGIHTLLVAVVVLTNAGLNLAFIPFLGARGAATATACAFLVEAVLIAVLSRRLLRLRL